jgi:hypothetical protein
MNRLTQAIPSQTSSRNTHLNYHMQCFCIPASPPLLKRIKKNAGRTPQEQAILSTPIQDIFKDLPS